MDSRRQLGLVNKRIAASLKRAIDEHCAATGDTHAIIAEECGISAGYLSNMCTGVAPVAMDIVATVMRITGRQHPGQEFARVSGAMWITAPAAANDCAEIARVLKEIGDVVSAYGEAKSDGRVDATEETWLVEQVTQAQEALAAFLATVHREAAAPVRRGAM